MQRLFLKIGVFTAFSLLAGSVLFVPIAGAQTEPSGASLFLGPPSGTFVVGNTFTVSLYLNTGGRYVNAVEAHLTFPPDKLQVVSPASSGKSLIEIWAAPPTYSNRDGTLSFQGGVYQPGINTESGVVATITFRVKAIGAAAVKIGDRSRVFLNDGTGTDVLSKTSGALYTFVLPPPAGPFVTSPTHPDQERWYSQNSAVFRWEVAPEVAGYSYSLSQNPVEDPDNISEGQRANIAYENLSDGVHYFHIKSLRAGMWGGVTHYSVKVDSHPPADFRIDISPSPRTSQRRPIIVFNTTDTGSGVDHYDLRIIRVDGAETSTEEGSFTPFFIEATSPYSESLEFGRYHVVVRAYDHAQNYTQETSNLVITSAFLEVLSGDGIWVAGKFMVPWGAIFTFLILLLVLVFYLLRRIIVLRRSVAQVSQGGTEALPRVGGTVRALREKQEEYKNTKPPVGVWIALVVGVSMIFPGFVSAAVNPPIVNLFPQTISNDEIPYIGGYADASGADVVITLQNIQSGESYTYSVMTGKNGEWFHSFAQFLDPGSYQLWTQLKVGEETSVPSAQLTLTVAPTALQIGGMRVSFERLYGALLAAFFTAFVATLIAVGYHSRRLRREKAELAREIREAEESVRRGFAVLRQDIQSELAIVHRMKASRELSLEEKLREEKLLKDLEWASAYIGKEVWDIHEAGEKLK